ncbi:conjugal transfer transcriptional regulator TraJ [Azohydromonas aeria]|uniref:conjugal transfer transcriptional regulator TraJ n=1 Tax=Azohydromonas aeria TaxID=2590212 RepID=UPI0012FC62E0|nr:conjugal transfer transcriptional regulator TraJ [Azohydromonas aeria]
MPPPSNAPAKRPVPQPKQAAGRPAHEVRRHCLRVLVNDQEKATLRLQASTAKRSVGRYLREVGLGYKLHSAVDLDAVRELARINGDLGRLGGLLKLWLAADARTARFTPATVQVLLERITAQQDELGKVMQEVVRPRGRT